MSAGMQGRLNKLQGEFGATSANAQKVLSFLGPKDKLSNQVSTNKQHFSTSSLSLMHASLQLCTFDVFMYSPLS